jgi:hypothetical protein
LSKYLTECVCICFNEKITIDIFVIKTNETKNIQSVIKYKVYNEFINHKKVLNFLYLINKSRSINERNKLNETE